MKLYFVTLLCNHCEEIKGVTVACTEDEAISKIKKDNDIEFTYSSSAEEINEIDGYKVIFHKGKKIFLQKQENENGEINLVDDSIKPIKIKLRIEAKGKLKT